METIDEEFLGATIDFIDRANRDKKPFFAWFNPTRMHIWTRLKPELQGKTGLGLYPDGMVEHDGQVGQLLKKLDDLGIANNTIVIYTTDNGAETFTWPDGGTTPFRGEKNTNWEGGYRVPAMVRWPGLVPPRTEINDIFSAEDWATTLVRRRASPTSRQALRATMPVARTSRCTSTATTSATCSPARVPISAANSSTGPMTAISPACVTTSTRRCSWSSRRTASRSGCSHSSAAAAEAVQPALRPVRARQHEAGDYVRWFIEHIFVLVPAQAIVGQHLNEFQQFPPRQSRVHSRSSRRWKS